MACDEALLAELRPFALLDDGHRAALARLVDLRQVGEQEVLFRSGDPGETLYVVAEGEVELSLEDNVGEKIVLATAAKGDLFGELALLDEGSRTATAVTRTPALLVEVARDDLLRLIESQPGSAVKLLAALASMTRRTNEVLRSRVLVNPNQVIEERMTVLQRIADWIAWFSGSMSFLFLNAALFAVWIGVNTLRVGVGHFDPFPFGLLTMIVSLEAIFLSCFVLISQNRQSQKDRLRADVDYEVNVRAEREIAALHAKSDRLYEQTMARLRDLEKRLEREAVGR
ncbi:MAG TPA: DUF1003 domain-containing protein [Thermoanaerobaculia bacterium]|nr:DUF1003 domain-containing protein [Thermoanaerobaculia bacterium]